MAITAQDAEILKLCGDERGGMALTVLGDLSLTIELAAGSVGEGRVRSDGVSVGRLRRLGGARLRSWGLPCSLVDNAELLVSELVTNALRHGTGREIVLHFILATDLLLISVDDRSPGRPLVGKAGPEDEGGRGLYLVDAIASAWGVSSDESRTWCALATRRRERN